METLSGKVALVTGGSSGIGLGIAKAFAEAGATVLISYRREDRLEEALAHLGASARGRVHAIRMDITDRACVARSAEEVKERFGKLHILCNNAGANVLGTADEATLEDWDWTLDVNLGGAINCLFSFLPLIKAHGEGGHIVNVASMASFIPTHQAGVYTTSKFALRGLAESLRLSLFVHDIGVSLVCPGLTNTKIWRSGEDRANVSRYHRALAAGGSESMLAKACSLGMDPDEVGRVVLAGMLRGEFYIFTHPEFRDEVRELHEEIEVAFRNGPVDARRLAFEKSRRAHVCKLKKKIDARRQEELAAQPQSSALRHVTS